ncbi:MAG: HNH endonuclease [Actinobacteria bacterium]|nr:HNH endonuclease [Actinomycetota bacterium]
MGDSADGGISGGHEPLRLPPTLQPKRRRDTRWARPIIGVAVLAIGAVVASSLLNHEVSKRLATVPIEGTTTTSPEVVTTTTVAAVAVTPKGSGARSTRRAPTTSTPAPSTTSTTVDVPPETQSEVIAALDKLAVADEHSQAGKYGRFGYWRDDDKDGCNTRAEVLIAESSETVERTVACRILRGKWLSPYDNAVLTDPIEVAIDHVVTITEAWESGAWQWTDIQRNDYVNDLEHPDFLVAVSNAIKDTKGDKDPGEWLPPVETYRCDYLRAWVHLKTVYKMSVDPGEREAIAVGALHC